MFGGMHWKTTMLVPRVLASSSNLSINLGMKKCNRETYNTVLSSFSDARTERVNTHTDAFNTTSTCSSEVKLGKILQ